MSLGYVEVAMKRKLRAEDHGIWFLHDVFRLQRWVPEPLGLVALRMVKSRKGVFEGGQFTKKLRPLVSGSGVAQINRESLSEVVEGVTNWRRFGEIVRGKAGEEIWRKRKTENWKCNLESFQQATLVGPGIDC